MSGLVSVVIPLFNKAKYVDDAIRSAVGVEYRPLEIVVVDDGSTDGSYERARDWADRHPELVRVEMHPGHVNLGPGASRNLGISRSAGGWIAFLDADDLLLPHRFRMAASILASQPEIDAVFESVRVEPMTPEAEVEWGGRSRAWSVPRSGADPSLEILRTLSLWASNGILIRKSVFARIGVFDEHLRVGEDRDLWLRLALCARLAPGEMDDPVGAVRRGDLHTWTPSRVGDTYRDVGNTARVRAWALRHPRLVPRERARALARGFEGEIVRAIKIFREERSCRRAFVTALAAPLVPRVLTQRAFWGNLAYCLRESLTGAKR